MFEWDPRKAGANAEKHGVTFDVAATVFADPSALDGPVTRRTQQPKRGGSVWAARSTVAC